MAVRSINIGRASNRGANTPVFLPRDSQGRPPQLPGLPATGNSVLTFIQVQFRNNRVFLSFSTSLVPQDLRGQVIGADVGMAFRNADNSKWIGFSVNTMNASATTDTTEPYDWRNITGDLRTAVNSFRRNMANEDFFFDYDTEGLIPDPNAAPTGKPFRFAGRNVSQVNFMGKALSKGHYMSHRFYET